MRILACGEIALLWNEDESAIGVAFVRWHQGGTSQFITNRPEVCRSLPTRCEKNNVPHVKLSAPRHMDKDARIQRPHATWKGAPGKESEDIVDVRVIGPGINGVRPLAHCHVEHT